MKKTLSLVSILTLSTIAPSHAQYSSLYSSSSAGTITAPSVSSLESLLDLSDTSRVSDFNIIRSADETIIYDPEFRYTPKFLGSINLEDNLGTGSVVSSLDTTDINISAPGQMYKDDIKIVVNPNLGAPQNIIQDNSFLFDFTLQDSGDDFNIIITKVDASAVMSGQSQSSTNAAKALLEGDNNFNCEVQAIRNRMLEASNATGIAEIAEAATSDTSGSAVQAGVSVSTQTKTITNTRLASVRNEGLSNSTVSGFAAGDDSSRLETLWGQGFYQNADQDQRDGVAGYDAETYGFIAGADTAGSNEDWILGAALSYGLTDVESEAADQAQTDIDAYQISIYGNYDLTDDAYISGQVGYIYGQNETTRTNVGGVSGLTANGEFDSHTISASAEVGRSFAHKNATFTPFLTASAVHYTAEGYTETGAGTASLTVGEADMDVLEFGAGVDTKLSYTLQNQATVEPAIRIGVHHDVIGDTFETTNQFGSLGSSFTVSGFEPAKTTFNIGAGVTYFAPENWELSARYDYEFKSDYDAHSGSAKAAYKF